MVAATAPQKAQQSLKEKKRELYREAVLDAAERVFADEGYEATKVQRIAAESGVSLTTLYSAFESKWEIYRGVHRRRLNEVLRRAQGIVRADASALDMFIEGTRMQLAFFMQHRDYTKMQLKEVTAWATTELDGSPEQIEGLDTGLTQMAAVFAQGIDEGVFVDDEPTLMARMAVACLQVRLATWMGGGCEESTEVVTEAALRHLLRSYCKPDRLEAALEAAGLEADS